MNSMQQQIEQICRQAKQASDELALLEEHQKNTALAAMADALEVAQESILALNLQDVHQAQENSLSAALVDRMALTESRFVEMVSGIRKIIELPDPVGRILASWNVPSELKITRVAIPLGVLCVIYESRPNVTADAASLGLKAGNAMILRGGSDCVNTNRAIVEALQQGLQVAEINPHAIQYVPIQEREALSYLLQMDEYIDVIIPRGSKQLIQHIAKESNIPVFRHLEGICHTYIHEKADLNMACDIVENAKMRRPGICGATETLLIDEAIAAEFLPEILDRLLKRGCEIRGDQLTQSLDSRVKAASEADWSTEYLEAILSVKAVKDIEQAIQHINQYSSSHTEAIITEDHEAATQFLHHVNSANVMHNCSTQFADGGEFGMGAEIGISTGKLHARGPVGLEQLTTFKYRVQGGGQIRQDC